MKHNAVRSVVTRSMALVCAGFLAACAGPSHVEHGLSCGCGHVNSDIEAEIKTLHATNRPWLPPIPSSHEPGEVVPFAMCFDSASPPSPELVAQVNLLIRNSLLKYNAVDRWTTTSIGGATTPGQPITLRWSFVPDTVNAPNLTNVMAPSTLFSTMDTKFGAANRALWISKFTEAFNRWGAITGVNYVHVTNGTDDWDDGAAWGSAGSATRGDVRIACRALDGGSGVLAFNSFPNDGDMVLDSNESWQQATNNYRFLRNIVMHEHGHGLGLAHACPVNLTKLLEPTYTSNFDGPQQDDLRAVHELYGDVYEPNGTSGTATSLPAMGYNSNQTVGTVPAPTITNGSLCALSIDGDQDWYRVNTTEPVTLLTVSVTPLGTSYSMAAQSGNSCPVTSGTEDALNEANLAIEIRDFSGLSVLATSDISPIGAPETLSGVLVGGSGGTLKVFESGAMTDAQEYRISITTAAPTGLIASESTYLDRVHLFWATVPRTTQYQLWRSESNSRFSATPIATVAGTSYDDFDVLPSGQYYYWLRVQQTGAAVGYDIAGPVLGVVADPVIVACPADIGIQGGTPGSDQMVDNNDFVAFIDLFFLGDLRADFGMQGGTAGQDGQLDNNDFVAFIDAFFLPCP